MSGSSRLQKKLQDIDAIAQEMANAARRAILPYFRAADLETGSKETVEFDPVTEADRQAEQVMREILTHRRPNDGILGEEFGEKAGKTNFTWVLDPIDGTRGFISGTPTWGTLIAVSDETGPIYGLIDQPYISERYVGSAEHAFYNGPSGTAPLACRKTSSLEKATLFTTFPEVGSEEEGAAFRAVSARTKLTRYGMDCYAYALLAAGQIDLVIEAGLQPYDIQAPIAVIEAAGGIVTDWSGGPAHHGGRVLAAANADLHAEALAIIQGVVS